MVKNLFLIVAWALLSRSSADSRVTIAFDDLQTQSGDLLLCRVQIPSEMPDSSVKVK